MIKVSVIVPVYNVEKYIEKCLNSLVKQTLKEIEIIVVNDGSPDNSQDVIDKFVKKYPKKVIGLTKKNGGLSSARNFGLKHVNGEYITFVDSDDYLDLTALEKMYNKAKSNNFDIVACDLEYIYESYTENVVCNINNDLINKDQVKSCMTYIYPAACNKIYKNELLKNLKFKEKIWYEDVEFMYRLLPLTNSIGVVKEPLYKYLQRENAITSTFNDKIFNYIDNFNGLVKYYKENDLLEEYKNELEYSYVRYLYATMVKGMINFKDYNKYKNGVELAITNVKRNFPNYRKNKYFYRSLKGIYLLLFNKCIASILYKLKSKN